MAAFHANTDRKQISIILNLIKFDCIELYEKFRAKELQLKQAIELYEEFMTEEINTLFQKNNNFSDIVLNHKKEFGEFIENAGNTIFGDEIPHQNGTFIDESTYVLFISLQEWLAQGLKGQQFCFMIDIDAFDLEELETSSMLQKASDSNGQLPDTIRTNKKAKISATDFVNETFIAFKGDKKIDCDNNTKNRVKRIQHALKKQEAGIWPVKCVLPLLQRLFFGVTCTEDSDAITRTFKSEISVSYEYEFASTGIRSQLHTRNVASLMALQNLCEIENKFVQRKPHIVFPQKFAEEIQELVTNAFEAYTDVKLDIMSNVLAGIVQTTGPSLKMAEVVVLSTGTKNIDAEALLKDGGYTLPDTHAEVVARRCLMYYFYDQLELYLDSAKCHQSIFEKSLRGDRLKLKENVHFHLYISKGPCGDATTYGVGASPLHPDRGLLRAKVEKAEGNKKLIELTETQNGYDLQTKPLYTITCSDKIARWNVVGVQGALLSRIIEPIYFDAIILGKNLSIDHITHSFYGRIENSIGYLPRFYYHNKPFIVFTESGRRNTHHEAPKLSYNWVIGTDLVEKIESKTGKLIGHDGISRLSKRKLFHKFVHIKHKLPNIDRNGGSNVLYADEKSMAYDFQDAKNACIEAFYRSKLGNWKFVQKPSGIDRFYDQE